MTCSSPDYKNTLVPFFSRMRKDLAYRQTTNIIRTKSQNLNVSRLVLPNQMSKR